MSDDERKLLSLPYRYGGLGLLNPCETAQLEYNASKMITSDLSRLITQQNMDFSKFDKEKMKETKLEVKNQRESSFKNQFDEVREKMDEKA